MAEEFKARVPSFHRQNQFVKGLWKYSKVVERDESTGKLNLKLENMMKIVSSVPAECRTLPVVLLAVIGPNQSGKSFCSNLILERLRKPDGQSDTIGWMNDLTLHGQPLTGFAYGNGATSVTEGCRIPDEYSSGIYMWPEPFRVTVLKEERLVWVLDTHYTKDDGWKGVLDSLQSLLCIMCSRLVEISNGSKLLCSLGTKTVAGDLVAMFCKNITFAVFNDRDRLSVKSLADPVLTKSENFACNIFVIGNNLKPLHDKGGRLVKGIEHITENLKLFVSSVLEERQLQPKTDTKDAYVTMNTITNFLGLCVNGLNSVEEIMVVNATSGSNLLAADPNPKKFLDGTLSKQEGKVESSKPHYPLVKEKINSKTSKLQSSICVISKPEKTLPSGVDPEISHGSGLHEGEGERGGNSEFPTSLLSSASSAKQRINSGSGSTLALAPASQTMKENILLEMFQDALNEWINHELKLDNISEIMNVQDIFAETISGSIHEQNSRNQVQHFLNTKIKPYLKSLEQVLHAFKKEMQQKTEKLVFFHSTKLQNVIETNIENAIRNKQVPGEKDASFDKFYNSGCQVLGEIYTKRNDTAIDEHAHLISHYLEAHRNFLDRKSKSRSVKESFEDFHLSFRKKNKDICSPSLSTALMYYGADTVMNEDEDIMESTMTPSEIKPGLSTPFDCKIVQRNPTTKMLELTGNLETFMSLYENTKSLPIVLISTVGPHQSGKSLYANLIMKNLAANNSGGWINDYFDVPLTGFAFGEAPNKINVDCVVPDSKGGIYLWPHPFLQNNKQIWVLDAGPTNQEEFDDVDTLQALLCVLSSRLIEITFPEKKLQTFQVGQAGLKDLLCPRITFITHSTSAKDPITRSMNQFAQCGGKGDLSYDIKIIPRNSGPLHDEEGRLNGGNGNLLRQVGNAIKSVLNDEHLRPKLGENKETLDISRITQFFRDCVKQVNSTFVRRKDQSEDGIPSSPVPDQNLLQRTPHQVNDITKSTNSNKLRRGSKQPGVDEKQVTKLAMELVDSFEMKEISDLLCNRFQIWIDKKLNITNISQVIHIYEKVVNDAPKIPKNQLDTIHPELRAPVSEHFRRQLISRIEKEMRPLVNSIQEAMISFRDDMSKNFEKQVVYSQMPDLEHEIQKKIEKIARKYKFVANTTFSKFIPRACRVLGEEFKDHNLKVQKDIATSPTKCIDVIKEQFKKECESIQSAGPHPPEALNDFHVNLENHFRISLQQFLPPMGINQFKWLTVLMEALKPIHQHFQAQNVTSLERDQKIITKLITEYKGNYEDEMNAVLDKNVTGVSRNAFESLDESCRRKVLADFRNALHGEPSEPHIRTLANHIEKTKEFYKDENDDKLRSQTASPTEAPSTKKTENFDNHTSVTSDDFKENLRSKVDNITNTPLFSQYWPEDETSATPMQVELPPLFIHPETGKIWVSMIVGEGPNDIIFPLGAESISDQIGLTKGGSWLIGSDLEEEIKKPSKFHRGIEKIWSVVDCLLPSAENWAEEIYIDKRETESRTVKIEFLLGFFLALVKDKADMAMNGTTSEVIIVVPFWLASVQRQQVKQSGQVAGFVKVHLVNENTALACSGMDSRQLNGKRYSSMVIVSENSDRIDISIYDVAGSHLSLVAHRGDYEIMPRCSVKRFCDETPRSEGLTKMWPKAVGQMEEKTNKSWEKNKSESLLIVSWRSDSLKDMLLHFAKSNMNNFAQYAPSVTNHHAAKGASMLVGGKCTVKEGIAYGIRAGGKNTIASLVAVKKGDTFGETKVDFGNLIHSNSTSFHFYQKACYSSVPIGELIIQEDQNKFDGIVPTFRVSGEGIVEMLVGINLMKKVGYSEPWKRLTEGSQAYSEARNYKWSPVKPLMDEEIAVFKSLIDKFKGTPNNSGKTQELILFGEQLMKSISHVHFKLDAARNIVLRKIHETLDILRQTPCSLKDMEDAEDLLTSFKIKYL